MRVMVIGGLAHKEYMVAAEIATKRGAKVHHFADIETSLESLRSGRGADVVIIDVNHNIPLLIESLNQEHIYVPVVAAGIGTTKQKAIAAINAGAKEYLPLPPHEELIAAILESLSQEASDMLGSSSKMNEVRQLANQIAPADASVLITGQSGTGKEVLSRYIHQASKRVGKPFISVNCAAIPDNLLESEMFGHEKGAFTGAIARRIGKFEEAHGGTLLLDEISEIDIRLQAKLLRAIQEREINRIGGNGQPVKVDIRIIATSNRDLREEVRQGRFREDLFFRLNVINIHLPPLHERLDDITTFAKHFASKYAKANGKQVPVLSEEAISLLKQHSWPGNIRELENTMHRAVLLSPDNIITANSLMLTPIQLRKDGEYSPTEQEMINSTLAYCKGDYNQAANILGISLRLLKQRLDEFAG
jgi:two-component system response regulator FlrC